MGSKDVVKTDSKKGSKKGSKKDSVSSKKGSAKNNSVISIASAPFKVIYWPIKKVKNKRDSKKKAVNEPDDKSSASFHTTETPSEQKLLVHDAVESQQDPQDPQNAPDSTLNITLLVIAVSLAFNRLKLGNDYMLTVPYSAIFVLTTFSFLTGYKWEIARNAAYNALGLEIKEDDKVNKSVNKSIPFRTVLHESGGSNRNMFNYQARPSCRSIGYVKTANTLAETYADKFEPLFSYRGMDIFTCDNPQEKIWKHPLLLKDGLRDKPTFIINVMATWANISTYLEMPSWVKKFDSIVETESDSNDIKALKRFFNGSDEYRNQRFKIMSSLITGPLLIRKLNPPPARRRVHSDKTVCTWHKVDECVGSKGQTHAAIFEVDVDLVTNKTIRRLSSIVKRNVKKMVTDTAFFVEKPPHEENEEPSACLGAWRMDHVDLACCPELPEVIDESILRTSLGMSVVDSGSIASTTKFENDDELCILGMSVVNSKSKFENDHESWNVSGRFWKYCFYN